MNKVKELSISKKVLYKIKIESPEEMKESFFKEEYEKAELQLKDIIEFQNNDVEDAIDNIIAFIGERGSGKTSAMLSFRDSIIKNELYDRNFNTLDNIDPSIMTKNDSIIEIIVGQMFKKFKKNRNNKDYIKEHGLVSCFENVFRDLKLLNDSSKYSKMGDNLENLIDLSSAIALCKNFKTLVTSFLKYINQKECNNKHVLLITIDDLDLNISSAQSMLEDIRKFLIQSNIVILMAIKIEQLEEVLIQKNAKDLDIYKKNYIDSINDISVKNNYLNEIRNKSIKYLEKIIPYNRRIVLPKVDVNNVQVLFKEGFENLYEYKENTTNEYLKVTISKIYFKKYGYMIESESHLKEILPSSLRGWIQLFAFLNIENNEGNEDGSINNIKNLKNYYINHINNEIESLITKDILVEFLECPIEELNRKVFLFLNDYVNAFIPEIEKSGKNYIDELNPIFKDVVELNNRKRFVLKENISLGYVVSWIKLYENYMYLGEEVKIIELIKLILSLRYIEVYYKEEHTKLVNIIGRDFDGRYFELVRNKHNNIQGNRFESETIRNSRSIKDIVFNKPQFTELTNNNKSFFTEKEYNEYFMKGKGLENKLVDIRETDYNNKEDLNQIEQIDSLLDMYFTIFEPVYQDQWKTRNSIFYRNEFNLNNDWTTKHKLQKYIFKPFNFIGYKYLPYKDKFYGNNINNKKVNKQVLFVINIDLFMTILFEFNKNMNKRRPKNEPVDFLCSVIDTFNLEMSVRYDKFNIPYENNNEIILSQDEKIFLKKNINYTIYKEMKGYSLEYDDEDEYFLYYNYKQVQKIKEDINGLDISTITSEEDSIDYIKNKIEEFKTELENIDKRINKELYTAGAKKRYVEVTKKSKEFKIILGQHKIKFIDESIDAIKSQIDAICEEIENIGDSWED